MGAAWSLLSSTSQPQVAAPSSVSVSVVNKSCGSGSDSFSDSCTSCVFSFRIQPASCVCASESESASGKSGGLLASATARILSPTHLVRLLGGDNSDITVLDDAPITLVETPTHADSVWARVRVPDLAPAATYEITLTLRNRKGTCTAQPVQITTLQAPIKGTCGGVGPLANALTAASHDNFDDDTEDIDKSLYKWDQTPHAVEVSVPLPPSTAARDVRVDVKPTRVNVACKNHELFSGALHARVVASDDGDWSWELRRDGSDRPSLFLELTKSTPTFARDEMWPCVIDNHPRVDTARFTWTRGGDDAFFGDEHSKPDVRTREEFVDQLAAAGAIASKEHGNVARDGLVTVQDSATWGTQWRRNK